MHCTGNKFDKTVSTLYKIEKLGGGEITGKY